MLWREKKKPQKGEGGERRRKEVKKKTRDEDKKKKTDRRDSRERKEGFAAACVFEQFRGVLSSIRSLIVRGDARGGARKRQGALVNLTASCQVAWPAGGDAAPPCTTARCTMGPGWQERLSGARKKKNPAEECQGAAAGIMRKHGFVGSEPSAFKRA